MGTLTGVGGIVTVGGNAVAEINGWSFDESATAIGSSNIATAAETNLAGKTSWSGSIECMWDKADATGQGAMTIGATLTVVFKPEGATIGDQIYTGTAIITGRSQAVADEAIVSQTFTLQGSGALVSGSHA